MGHGCISLRPGKARSPSPVVINVTKNRGQVKENLKAGLRCRAFTDILNPGAAAGKKNDQHVIVFFAMLYIHSRDVNEYSGYKKIHL
jgi:hypothetical protein